MTLFYINIGDEKRKMETVMTDTEDEKKSNAKKKKKKSKIREDTIVTGIRGSKKQVEKSDEEAREEVRGQEGEEWEQEAW